MTVAERLRRKRKITSTTSADRQHQLELHVVDRGADGGGAVGEDRHVHRRPAATPCSCGSSALMRSTTLDDVGAGLALDVQDHRRRRRSSTPPACTFSASSTTSATSDDAHRRAVAVGDDQRAVVGAREQLVVGADRDRPAAAPSKLPFAWLTLACASAVRRSSRLEAVRRERRRIRLDADRRLLAAADAHQADAGQLRDLLRQARVGEILDLRQRQRRPRSAPASGSARRPDSSCCRSAGSAGRAAGRCRRR